MPPHGPSFALSSARSLAGPRLLRTSRSNSFAPSYFPIMGRMDITPEGSSRMPGQPRTIWSRSTFQRQICIRRDIRGTGVRSHI